MNRATVDSKPSRRTEGGARGNRTSRGRRRSPPANADLMLKEIMPVPGVVRSRATPAHSCCHRQGARSFQPRSSNQPCNAAAQRPNPRRRVPHSVGMFEETGKQHLRELQRGSTSNPPEVGLGHGEDFSGPKKLAQVHPNAREESKRGFGSLPPFSFLLRQSARSSVSAGAKGLDDLDNTVRREASLQTRDLLSRSPSNPRLSTKPALRLHCNQKSQTLAKRLGQASTTVRSST